jgi:hypothetical protein
MHADNHARPNEKQRALYAEHFPERTDGGLRFTLEDLLRQMDIAAELGVSDAEMSRVWGTPINFIRSLRAAQDKSP